jgi:HEAT repeat protein
MMDEQAKAIKEKQERTMRLYGSAEKAKEGSVVLDLNKPTPGRLKAGFRYPASPDIYWSVADEFKNLIAPDPEFETHAIRLQNYNYINLAQALLLAIAEIGSSEAIDAIKPYAAHPLRYLRSYAALALESTRNKAALGPLKERLASEEDPVVKVYLNRAIVMLDKSSTASTRDLLKSLKSDDQEVRLMTVHALNDLGMGETENFLRAALEIENNEAIRSVLLSAISNAQLDNAMPVNY